MSLLPIDPADFAIDLALAYASPDNFTGAPVYARAEAYLHADALPPLRRAVALAAAQGLRLRILDAFRPTEAQWALWRHTPDPTFIADPRRGSLHSRGAAVDLTLVAVDSGAALDMGTGFDAFTPLSHHGSLAVSPQAQRHRCLLLGLMCAAGWEFFAAEWWHYQLPQAEARYPLFSDSCLPRPMMAADCSLAGL